MFPRAGGLSFPSRAAIDGFHYPAIRAADPSRRGIVWRKRDAVEMIACVNRNRLTNVSAVLRREDRAASADDKRLIVVADKHAGERDVRERRLLVPMKTAVCRSQDRVVRAHCEARLVVLRKMDRIQRITLRQRILPDPSKPGFLRRNSKIAAEE